MGRPSAKQTTPKLSPTPPAYGQKVNGQISYGRPRLPEQIDRAEGAYVESDPVITDQSAKERTDVTNIIATYHRTGIMPGVAARQPTYGYVPEQTAFEAACIAAEAANATVDPQELPDDGLAPEDVSQDVSDETPSPDPDPDPADPAEPHNNAEPAPELTNEGA